MKATRPRKLALITGGAGFIATNLAARLLRDGWRVRVFDNLSRAGVTRNLSWLRAQPAVASDPSLLDVVIGDVRDRGGVRGAVAGVNRVFHFAAQVAVTTSLIDPVADFDVNAGGTLNLLEALRTMEEPPGLLFTSTNKVYGHLDGLPLRLQGDRYEPRDELTSYTGISENHPLDFHSPYGCSKGAADQYVLDYARTFGLPATVFRMSCIYGPHQCGTEDQGWVAHFLIQALKQMPLTLYGDGRQVRDVLFVEDLVDAMMHAHDNIDRLSGQAFNIGGGAANTTSLLELIALIGKLLGEPPSYRLDGWRRADQRYYVSDIRRFQAATGWAPKVPLRTGVERLAAWLLEHHAAASTRRPPLAAAQGVAS